ncbi:MAG TPA: hypothetical protein VFR30_09025 [Lysobacter sp.]|nr:hypothetical protein [Lysobacter sp.]
MSTVVIMAGVALFILVVLVATLRGQWRRSASGGSDGADAFESGSFGADCADSGSDCGGGDGGGGD